jgi:hypothetical protein
MRSRLNLSAVLALASAVAVRGVSAAAPILGQYWPAYKSATQSVSQVPWSYSSKNGIAYYFGPLALGPSDMSAKGPRS